MCVARPVVVAPTFANELRARSPSIAEATTRIVASCGGMGAFTTCHSARAPVSPLLAKTVLPTCIEDEISGRQPRGKREREIERERERDELFVEEELLLALSLPAFFYRRAIGII